MWMDTFYLEVKTLLTLLGIFDTKKLPFFIISDSCHEYMRKDSTRIVVNNYVPGEINMGSFYHGAIN